MNLIAIVCAGAVLVQPAPDKPVQDRPLQELPTLDEVLGLKPRGEVGAVSRDPLEEELKKALGREEEGDLLAQAADLMDRSAKRLGESKDAGLDTQRLQEDAIRKLDALIAQAQNNQQKKQSKKKKQQDKQEEQQQQQQSQKQPQPKGAQTASEQAQAGPAMQEAELKAALAAAGATWGNLPPHLRDALRQGKSDQFSSLYQQLTEQYYKRLAEEPKK